MKRLLKFIDQKALIFSVLLFAMLPGVAQAAFSITEPNASIDTGFQSFFCAADPAHPTPAGVGWCQDYWYWIVGVWSWAMAVAIPLSVVMLAIAALLWAASGGDPNRIKTAKKMIIGVAAGLGLLILARIVVITLAGEQYWRIPL